MSADSTAISKFIARQRYLLAKERDEEIARSSLLLTDCGPRLLEQKGLCLSNLGVVGISVGLGGKTLIEFERPSAYHSSPVFPPHTFRSGDLARIEAHASVSAQKKPPKKPETVGSQPVEGVVFKISDTRIVLAVDVEEPEVPERCRMLKLANSVTYDRMDAAIDTLEKMTKVCWCTGHDRIKNVPDMNSLHRVLLGLAPPSELVELSHLKFFNDTLNASQKEAVRLCLEAPEVACIHGPPGTGKTHTLIEVIRQLTFTTPYNPKPLRVLVCGASNLSVDNILERLLALPVPDKGSKLKVTRIGHPARVMARNDILNATLDVQAGYTDAAALARDVKNEIEETMNVLSGKGKGAKGKRPRGAERKKMWEEVRALRKEYRQREGGVIRSVLSEAQVVLATCHSAGGSQLRNHKFDVVIIDEATQAIEAVCWIPIFKASKLILAGDPMQLPPTVLSITGSGEDKPKDITLSKSSASNGPLLRPPRSLETTLFDRLERMYGPSIKCMLQIQYRMHESICAFPSNALYSSKLRSDASVAAHVLSDLPEVSSRSHDEDEAEILDTPVTFFDTAGCEYFERLEGDGDEGSRCNENETTIVKYWVDKLVSSGVSPSQIAIITPYQAQVTLLVSLIRPQYGPDIEVGTVDGMQGREKEAVIISLVRSNDKREVGFLREKRRMNVAMTRAKRHLCVVGDSSTVCHGGRYLKRWLAWLEANADVRYAGSLE
ncbi:P-loop containing nucleoside triphosphate hydrolase protein [Fistulina hepatica ATCC 64428]|uniref:DNA helicase n=1 Tax=Fistulina hepatica ATCC 64428 TaxID=1128425 RepID=A0A0D7ACC7_9AGAR|nr:P-loop containing nucleoside triphosphate hydrolase protein [Fistulina hepatica ATCC 64428]